MKSYTWNNIFNDILKNKKILIQGNVLSIISALLSVPTPLVMPTLIDEIILNKPNFFVKYVGIIFSNPGIIHYLITAFSIVILLRFLVLVTNMFQIKSYAIISKDIVFNMRCKILKHLENISMSSYESFATGDIASRMISDLNTIDDFISKSVSRFITSSLTIICICLVLFMINPMLAMLIIILNPIVIILSSKLSKKVAQLKTKENKSISIFQDAIIETMELFPQLRSSNRETSYINILVQKAKNIKDNAVEYGYKGDSGKQISFFVFLLGVEFFRAIIIFFVFSDSVSVGMMIAVFAYLWFMAGPIDDMINIQYAYNRINETLAIKQETKYPNDINPFIKQEVSVSLKNVSFSYGEKNILKNVNLEIKQGEKIALIGSSGGGKTTLAQLIVGFYEIDSGDILFNDISYKKIGLDVVRENVFLVLQSPILFNDSVRENITMGKEYSDEQINNALRISQLYEVVESMKNGLDSVLGKHGIRLSGGQRQRLAIARMVLKNPKVIILDESTSSLDTTTEAKLYKALDSFLRDKTVITIAHRLNTIKRSDSIYEISNAKIKKI
ncbi:ABC-type multidrug transport system, ATPase and permease component [hydrothermal vent metagenome]|uniref:ABC-type multidrug transport system, ATPase and permease component n=1 Tax=hydrothermal vent metagenome TaxID=652676 RepID=A0A3B1EA46_9ZZZZ